MGYINQRGWSEEHIHEFEGLSDAAQWEISLGDSHILDGVAIHRAEIWMRLNVFTEICCCLFFLFLPNPLHWQLPLLQCREMRIHELYVVLAASESNLWTRKNPFDFRWTSYCLSRVIGSTFKLCVYVCVCLSVCAHICLGHCLSTEWKLFPLQVQDGKEVELHHSSALTETLLL